MPRSKIVKPKREAWHPADWSNADAGAIQALTRGDAPPDLQQRAIKYIVEVLCGTYDMSFRQNDRDTCFAEGKRFVGLQLVKLSNVNLAVFKEAPSEQG